MIDWGILAFFVLQVAMTFAMYHAWNGVKAEKSVLLAEQVRIAGVTAKIDGVSARLDAFEKGPGERTKRIEGLGEEVLECRREITKVVASVVSVDGKINALNGRIAARAKAAKRAALEDEGEQDPDPQGEEREQAQAPASPGSFSQREAPHVPGLPPGFGVLKRTGSHG